MSRAISANWSRIRICRGTSCERQAERTTPQPTDIKLRTQSRLLEVRFDDGSHFELPFEYLRVFSPSAEVKGHGGGEGVLQMGKQNVGISGVEPVGNYALRLLFDDGHNTGLYSWSLLHELGRDRAATGPAIWSAAPRPAEATAIGLSRSATMSRGTSRGAMDNSDRTVDFGFEKVAAGDKAAARPFGIRVAWRASTMS